MFHAFTVFGRMWEVRLHKKLQEKIAEYHVSPQKMHSMYAVLNYMFFLTRAVT